jgi:hypothetical protein
MTSVHPQVDYRPQDCERFVFAGARYVPEEGVARLRYRFDEHPELVEEIRFPHAPWPPEASRQAAFGRALQLLHLVAGVSYYKAGATSAQSIEGTPLSGETCDFLRALYVEGLAEFGWVNGIDLSGRIHFEPSVDTPLPPQSLVLPERALVAMGGGKDSLVALKMVQEAGMEVLPMCVGGSELIAETTRAAGLPLLRIGRTLAPELAWLNRAGALNGHVPVTAINSAIALCAAVLYGFRYIVFANERSADEATLETPDGRSVNHQYSKTSAFETAFRRLVAEEVSPDIEYFSALRPFSEIGIVQRFAKMHEFHGVYSSCNRNFHQDGSRVESRWCCDCPKCRFAALTLAVFLPPRRVRDIMGAQLLNDPQQVDGFRALCRLGRDKPFECVGEAGESRAALAELAGRPEWQETAVVRELGAELAGFEFPPLDDLLKPAGRHHYPAAWTDRLLRAWTRDETH